MGLFSVDGTLYRFITRLWDIIKLSLLWLVFSLPVVTFGAATIAAFDLCLKMVDEREGYIFQGFWKAFRGNLRKGIPLGLLFLAALYAVYLDGQILIAANAHEGILLALLIITAFVVYLAFIYAFALMARYENTVTETIRNSYRIALRYFGRTLLLAVLLTAEITLFSWNRTLMLIGLLIAPGCIMLTISGFAMYLFREIEREPGSVSNPEKLREEEESE